jgi:Tol biopolymer transport system component
VRRAVIGALLGMLALAPSADAAFPGQNGRIAYDDVGNIHTVNPDGTGHAQLTSTTGSHWGPEWSPDGQRIAFTSDRDGLGYQIYVMNADGSGQTRLTDPPGASASPAWSPDGQNLVFGKSDGDLWIMDADGSDQTRVASLPSSDGDADWSPDGSRIAFVRGYEIWVIRPDGTGLSQVTVTPPWPYTSDAAPDWSPDGSRIAYQTSYDADGEYCTEIVTIRPDRTGGTTVLPATCESGVYGNYYTGPAWSPDGERIASNDGSGLFTVRVNGSDRVPASGDAYGIDWQPLPVTTASTHARPKGATPMYLSLVPAYNPCTNPNSTHGPRLGFPSCNPPAPESPNLTVGVGDGSPALSRSVGSVRMSVLTGDPGAPDDTDVQLMFSITNVMKASDLSEYTGELRAHIAARLTDTDGTVSSTIQEFPLSWSIPCSTTPDPQLASACTLDTTLDAIVPGSAAEGTGAIWALDKLKVYDGGPDGDADTESDNSLFATQGVFVP